MADSPFRIRLCKAIAAHAAPATNCLLVFTILRLLLMVDILPYAQNPSQYHALGHLTQIFNNDPQAIIRGKG